MKRTGEILRKAREEKDLSLHEIGLSLKINNKILKAIEEGDASKLPAKTFLRGFVQSYANFLHLNTEEVLNVFYEEMGSTKPTPYKKEETINAPYVENTTAPVSPSAVGTEENTKANLSSTETSPEVTEETPKASIPESKEKNASKDNKKNKKDASNVDNRRTSASANSTQSGPSDIVKSSQAISSLDKKSNVKTYVGLIAIAALLAVIVFVKQMIDKYSKEAEVPSAEVAETIENATPILFDSNDTTLTDIDQAPSPLSPNAVETETTNAPATVTPPVAATPQASIKTETAAELEKKAIEEKKKIDTAAVPAVVAPVEPKKEEAKKLEPASVGKPVELIVEALDGVEIEYSAPNGTPQKIKLSSEQVHTFKSKSGLIITFSNGGVVNLILNGKEVGIPGDLGKPIKLSY